MSSPGCDSPLQSESVPRSPYPRPPWSLPEPLFLSLCSGCGECRDECPRGLLQRDAAGFPFIDFNHGSCDFCGECVDACARGALTRRYQGSSWRAWPFKAFMVGECLRGPDILCRQCVDVCGAHAILVTDSPLSIDARHCTGCGACLSTCPAGALMLYDPSFA